MPTPNKTSFDAHRKAAQAIWDAIAADTTLGEDERAAATQWAQWFEAKMEGKATTLEAEAVYFAVKKLQKEEPAALPPTITRLITLEEE
jgi:hypothetical protein